MIMILFFKLVWGGEGIWEWSTFQCTVLSPAALAVAEGL